MRRTFPCRILTPLLVAVVAAMPAMAADTSAQRSQMLAAISDAVAHGAAPVPAAALQNALDRASALTALDVDANSRASEVRLRVSGPLACEASFDAAGTLQLSLANIVVLPSMQTMTMGSGSVISSVTTELVSLHPQFVTRISVALKSPAGVAIRAEKGVLAITLTPGTSRIDNATMTAGAFALSKIEESVRRDDDIFGVSNAQMNESIERARVAVEEAGLALLQADLIRAVPSSKPMDTNTAVRKDFDAVQSKTAMLEAERATLLARRSDALDNARAAIAAAKNPDTMLAAFTAEEAKYATAIQSLAARANQQLELNTLLARRIQGNVLTAASNTTEASLAQVDSALAAVRTAALDQPALSSTLPAAHVEVAKANVALEVRPANALAVLTNDTDATVPPAPRARTTQSHRLSMDDISRGGTMAVLRSSPDEVLEAEDSGVIRLAQAQTDGTGITEVKPAPAVNAKASASGPRRYSVPKTTGAQPAFNLYNANMSPADDPLRQIVSLDFQGMDLTNVVSLLAEKGQINVIAGTEVTGTVTANLKNVPLGRAIEIVLRMNGLGIVEEAGVYRITSYDEAVAAQRQTRMIFLQNAQSDDIKKTLDDIIGTDSQSELISVSSNPGTNVIILAGPIEAIQELEGVVTELDVADQVVPTITMSIKLNYSEPIQLLPVVQPLLSEQGKISADPRTRQLIVTDTPVKVQEIQALVNTVDLPVKSVSIDALVVDAQLKDGAQTGIDWLLNTNHLQADGSPDFSTGGGFPITNPQAGLGMLSWGFISDSFNLRAEIQARVESTNSELLANPTVVTVENQPATINISREIPYQELTQTSEGGQLATTKFKDVGTILKVTPRVTHDDHILIEVDAKQSNTTGESVTGVPIEAKRLANTNLRMQNGQSVYIGGLRSFDNNQSNRKVPILGDIPVLNTLFKSQDVGKQHTELLIFLTCNILPDDKFPDLTPFQQEKFDQLGGTPRSVNGTRDLVRTYTHPEEQRDPIYKWRRAK